jgi:hypothetical protein
MTHNDNMPQDPAPSREGLNRRRILSLAAGGAVAATGIVLPASAAESHGNIETYAGIWQQFTVYEGNGAITPFGYLPSFHSQLDEWLQFWYNNTPSNFDTPFRVWSYGAHTDDRESVAHNAGRGFDLTRIYTTGSDGDLHRGFRADYDVWRNFSGDDLALTRRRYWATSASAHYHFRWVLTYLYNSAHWDHIHIDNTQSGIAKPAFEADITQVQHVQACCRFIWGTGTYIDGIWGDESKRHSHEVLQRIGKDGFLATSKEHWQAFNRASVRKGYDVQEY